MLKNVDLDAKIFVIAALVLFFVGGTLTTVAPPLIDKSWGKPFENSDPTKGLTGKLLPTPRRRNEASPSTRAKAAGIAIRNRRAPCSPIPSARAGAGSMLRFRRPTNSFTISPTCSAPSAPAPIFRMSGESTTRNGTAHISEIRAIWSRFRDAALPVDRRQRRRISSAGGLSAAPRPRQELASR